MASCSYDMEDALQSSDSEAESSDSDTEEILELADISLSAATLVEVLEKIQQDESVLRCSLGESVCSVAKQCALRIATPEMEKFAATVVGELQHLLFVGGKAKKSKRRIKLSNFWRKFHILRLSSSVSTAWQSCIASMGIATSIKNVTLQVILKRIVTNIIDHEVEAVDPANFTEVKRMSEREENVVRYMAGYVVSKMKKKFPLHSDLLDSLHTGLDLAFSGDDVHDYTKVWTEQVDRGGLRHVNDKFYNLSVAIEYVCRKYLDMRMTPKDDIACKIKEDCINSRYIAKLWKEIVNPSAPPLKSKELFMYIVQLWTNIRAHSFTKKWSDVLTTSKSHAKSVRKTLKRKGTEKETT